MYEKKKKTHKPLFYYFEKKFNFNLTELTIYIYMYVCLKLQVIKYI
jgi:hypothetical protein